MTPVAGWFAARRRRRAIRAAHNAPIQWRAYKPHLRPNGGRSVGDGILWCHEYRPPVSTAKNAKTGKRRPRMTPAIKARLVWAIEPMQRWLRARRSYKRGGWAAAAHYFGAWALIRLEYGTRMARFWGIGQREQGHTPIVWDKTRHLLHFHRLDRKGPDQ